MLYNIKKSSIKNYKKRQLEQNISQLSQKESFKGERDFIQRCSLDESIITEDVILQQLFLKKE